MRHTRKWLDDAPQFYTVPKKAELDFNLDGARLSQTEVAFGRPCGPDAPSWAVIVSRTVRLSKLDMELTLPSSDWHATVDFRRPWTTQWRPWLENFERPEAYETRRAGHDAYFFEYLGTESGTRRKFVISTILIDAGLLIVICEAPLDSTSHEAPAMVVLLWSLMNGHKAEEEKAAGRRRKDHARSARAMAHPMAALRWGL